MHEIGHINGNRNEIVRVGYIKSEGIGSRVVLFLKSIVTFLFHFMPVFLLS